MDAVVNGRRWKVAPDGTLEDRRATPRDKLTLPMTELTGRLAQEGLIDRRGVLTPEGRLLADVLLSLED